MTNKLDKDDRIKLLFDTINAQTKSLPAQMLFDYLGYIMGMKEDIQPDCY